MNYLKLKSLPGLLFLAIAGLACGPQPSATFAQANDHANDCRSDYELMRANAQANPGLAAQMGKKFLQTGCEDVYPTLVTPVQEYVAWYDQQQRVANTTQATTAAPNQQLQFKPGDRVEVDVIMTNNPQTSIYKKATVIEVNQTDKGYTVQVDPLPGKLPQKYYLPVRDYGRHWIRAIGGADNAPKILTEQLKTDADGTVLADREILDCAHLPHSGRNGTPLSVELGKKLIRCLYEKPAAPGSDGATTMDITGFTIGAARQWIKEEDRGRGNLSTLVYPVYVKWTQKTFYRTSNILKTDVEGSFTCFADTTNFWQCGSAAGPRKDSKTQEILVKK